jgi:dimethylglycine dehydrogenase
MKGYIRAVTGGLNLAGTRERLDWLKMARARGRYLGMNLEILSIDEAVRRCSSR